MKPHLWLIKLLGVIVPRHLRTDWRQEWESELRSREELLADWDRLDWKNRLDLLRRSTSAFWDALWLLPHRWEDEMIQDLRYGTRMLLKNPGFTTMAILSLALGIGANAAIFSLLDALLLKMLPVRQPAQLVLLEQSGASEFKRSSNISYAVFERLRKQKNVLEDAGYFSYAVRVNASLEGQVEVVEGQIISGSFFSVLGVRTAAGRTFSDAEDKGADAAAVAVISHGYWQRRFGLNPSVVGQSVILNGTPFTIIGVAAPEFFGVIIGNAPDIFLPSVRGDQILPRRNQFMNDSLPFVLARLNPNVTQQQAGATLTLAFQQALLEEAGTQLSHEKQQSIQNQTIKLQPAGQGFSTLRQQFSEPLRLLMGIVGLVLLIACANVANLLLARAAARRKEIAVRLALGAGRIRLIRQLLTESLLLSLAGGILGLVLASWCSRLLVSVFTSGRNPITSGSQLSLNVPLDSRVVIFTAIVSLLAVILFGLAPAWRATRLELSPALKDDARNTGAGIRIQWGKLLVVTQVVLSLILLVGAGLFVRSLSKLKSADLGFKRENVLLFSVDPPLIGIQREQIAGIYKQMIERISTIPGVRSVSLSRQGLLSGGGTQGNITVRGFTPGTEENNFTKTREGTVLNSPWFAQVGPRFFETTGMVILRGRDFGPQDNETARKVAVINEAFARYYFGDIDPIGQRFNRGSNNSSEVEIVGVVQDAKAGTIQERIPRTFYVPYLQDPGSWRETTFQVRTTGDPLTLVTAIRSEVRGINQNLPIFRVRTLEEQVDESLGRERLIATLSSLFGALALLLACAGLFGVMTYTVAQRKREIGIRMALGATQGDVLKFILRQGMSLTLLGVALGAASAYALSRYLESRLNLSQMLYGVKPSDPLTYFATIALLTAVAAVACYLPARRAAKVDPLVALRQE